MAILIGNTVEEATTVTGANGKELAFQAECTTGGTLEELHLIPPTTWGGASAVFLGIAAENAGAPGTVLGSVESSVKPTAKTPYALGGLSVALVQGTKYWLIALNSAAGQGPPILGKNAGAETVRTSTKTFTKIETTNEWAAAVPKGPLSFWGTGGGKTQPVNAALEFAASRSAVVRHRELASLEAKGSVQKLVGTKTLAATLTATGSLLKRLVQGLTASVLPQPLLQKAIDHPFAEAIIEEIQNLAAALSFEAKLARQIFHQFVASIKPTAVLGRIPTVRLRPSLTFKGALRPPIGKSLEAILFPHGTLLPFIKGKFIEPLAGALTFGATITKQTTTQLIATITPETGMALIFDKGLAALVSFQASLSKSTTAIRTAALSPTGQLTLKVVKQLLAQAKLTGSLTVSLAQKLVATLKPQGRLGRASIAALGASLTPAVVLQRLITKRLEGQLKVTGLLSKTILPRLVATLRPVGTITTAVVVKFQATLTVAGFLVRDFVQAITATLSFVGSLIPGGKIIYKIFSGLVNPSQKSGKSSPHESEGEG